VSGHIRDLKITPDGMLKQVTADTPLRVINRVGKDAPLPVPFKISKEDGTFDGCPQCIETIKSGGVIRGFIEEKGQLRHLIVDFNASRKAASSFYVIAFQRSLDKLGPDKSAMIQPPPGYELRYLASAFGHRTYRCDKTTAGSSGCDWTLSKEEAHLTDQTGFWPNSPMYAGSPEFGSVLSQGSFQAVDGIKLQAVLASTVTVNNPTSTEGQLWKASAASSKGLLKDVTYVQMLGPGVKPPASKNDKPGDEKQVSYSGTYAFYGPK